MTDLNKNVRVRFTDDGADKVRKNMKEIGADADKLSAKTISPKLEVKGGLAAKKDIADVEAAGKVLNGKKYTAILEANKARALKNLDEMNAGLKKFGQQKASAELGLRGTEEGRKKLDEFGLQVKKFGKLFAEAKVGIKGNEKADIELDRLRLRAAKWGKMVENAHVGVDGVERSIVEMRAINLGLDKFKEKLDDAAKDVVKHRGTFGNLVGVLGGDAVRNLFGGKGGGGGGADDEAAKAGDSAGHAFTGAFGQQLKVLLIGAIIAILLPMGPAIVPAFVGLGTAAAGAFVAVFTHPKLKNDLTKTFHGIIAGLGKDVQPMVKPLMGMISQVGAFFRQEAGPLKSMFSASTPILKGFVNLMIQLGKEAIPIVTQVLKQLQPDMPMVMAGFREIGEAVLQFIKVLGPGIKPAAAVFKTVMQTIKIIMIGLALNCDLMAESFDLLGKGIAISVKAAGKFFAAAARIIVQDAKDVAHWVDDAWQFIGGKGGGAKAMRDFLTKTIPHMWNDLTAFAKRIFGDIEKAVKAAWTATWSWAKNFAKSFVNDVEGIWNNILNSAKRIFGNIESFVKRVWDDVWSWAKNRVHVFWNDVSSIWGDIFNSVKRIFGNIENSVKHIWDDVWSWAKNRLHTFWDDVVSIWGDIFNGVKRIFGNIENSVKHIWDDVWSWAKNRLHSFWDDVVAIWGNLFNSAKRIFGDVENAVKHIWDDVWKWAKNRLSQFSSDVASLWDHIKSFASRTFNDISNGIKHVWSRLWQDLKNDASGGVNAIIKVINWLGDHVWNGVRKALDLKSVLPAFHDIGQVHLQNGGMVGSQPAGFANGGKIGGQGRGDRHHILAESGEVVVPRRVVPKYAMSFKADGIPGMQNGGLIGGIPAYVNGGTVPGTGPPSGGGPGADQNVKRKGTDPRATTGKKILKQNGDLSITGMLKDLKNDAISAAFKPVEAIVNTFAGELTHLGGVGSMIGKIAEAILNSLIQKVEGAASSVEGSASGQAIVKYAKQFVGHRYVLGGSGDYQTNHNKPFGPWDCAGFVSQMYDHFGLGSPTAGINVTALRNWSHNKKDKKPTVGGMAFFKGADGTATHPGHVGLVTGKNQSIQAMDEALGTRMADLSGALWYATPPGGLGGSGGYSGTGGTAIYSYLLNNIFSGHRIAATGALASIWGESGWNPESVGTGGNGIIGWTPPRKGIVTGNPTKDMAKQLPMVKEFIQQSGDEGVIHEMMGASTILQAANEWGKGVERYGINDVHSAGIAAAKKIADAYGNGPSKPAPGTPTKKGPTSGPSPTTKKALALGGMINEPVFGRGLRTGASYSIAENAPEYVTPMKDLPAGGRSGITMINMYVQGDSDPDGAARRIVQKVTRYEQHQGKRGDQLTFK